MASSDRHIRADDSTYQQWHSLLDNRKARNRSRRFLVQGVRPISQALGHGWPILDMLVRDEPALSQWARQTVDTARANGAAIYRVAPKLLADLGQHDDVVPELVAVAGMPADDLTRIRLQTRLVLLLDRPGSPGNLGSLIRSADAFGVDGLIVCGHAVDAYEPAVVRASTGSLFALPVVRADAPQPVLDWAESVGLQVIGTDEDGEPLDAVDLRGPVLVVVGNETRGMSAAWRAAATTTAAIPMRGSASSLNAANAGSIVLYEATRQRRAAGPAHQGW